MRLGFKIKHYFFGAFRELFVHHHGSLEFRAKIFTLVIAVNKDIKDEVYQIVENEANKIYKNDEDRAQLLILSTKEMVQKVIDDNGLDIDSLVSSIQNELKLVPRYAKKIDTEALRPILMFSDNKDIISYQENIIEFLDTTKENILSKLK